MVKSSKLYRNQGLSYSKDDKIKTNFPSNSNKHDPCALQIWKERREIDYIHNKQRREIYYIDTALPFFLAFPGAAEPHGTVGECSNHFFGKLLLLYCPNQIFIVSAAPDLIYVTFFAYITNALYPLFAHIVGGQAFASRYRSGCRYFRTKAWYHAARPAWPGYKASRPCTTNPVTTEKPRTASNRHCCGGQAWIQC